MSRRTQSGGNSPAKYTDILGLTILYRNTNSEKALKPYIEGLKLSKEGEKVIAALEDPSQTYYLYVAPEGSEMANTRGNKLSIDLTYTPIIETANGRVQTTSIRMLAHELGHLLEPNADEIYITEKYENGIMTPLDGMKRNYITTKYCH
jgi:hypothetical protein